ncbi:hypothetical protein COCMIDRAFT_2086 [Bipolaris oryzae ATCC 44560]|uniref:Spo12-like protein n=1 Tax=Bipolaris oryzae ATCC 44560 TaxID=930090 RepID=W6ZGK8_COCMI|nr:uncharacterized protein COCMIDRAFT_2086 [Bipolaris oryzae ATCC 44560]EUC49018.1 hypothetical protein COCMIDRAFT_2086 [Bipolaris oryzae ATCC 44560]
MASNVLAARDTNTKVKAMESPEKTKIKSLEYHRQVLHSRLDDKQESKYVSPSDDIMSPATQKLQAFKTKHAMKKSKPQTLFKKASSKSLEASKGSGSLMFADIPKADAGKQDAEA